MDKLVNVHEAAKLLGVCTQTLYQKFEGGHLPGYRVGRAIRFDPQELRAFFRRPLADKEIQNKSQ